MVRHTCFLFSGEQSAATTILEFLIVLLQPLGMSRHQYREIFTRDEIVLLIYYDPVPVSYHENLTFLPSMSKQHRSVGYFVHTDVYENDSGVQSMQRVRKSLLLQKGHPISRQGPPPREWSRMLSLPSMEYVNARRVGLF